MKKPIHPKRPKPLKVQGEAVALVEEDTDDFFIEGMTLKSVDHAIKLANWLQGYVTWRVAQPKLKRAKA